MRLFIHSQREGAQPHNAGYIDTSLDIQWWAA